MPDVHPTAVVSPEAELAPDVVIGPHAVIEPGVKIGRGSRIMAGAYVCSGTTLGESNDVHMQAVLGNTPQDVHFGGEESFLVVGDGNVIREMATVHRGTQPGSTTRIGSGCMLMVSSHVAHNCSLGDGVVLANGALLGGHVEVGERAFISGNVVVHQFERIGRLVMCAGGARVTKDVPPFCTMGGENRLRGLNRVGLRRAVRGPPPRPGGHGARPGAQASKFTRQGGGAGLDSDALSAIGRAYSDIFNGGRSPDVAAREVLEGDAHPAAREMAEFVLASERGVCRPARRQRDDADAPGE